MQESPGLNPDWYGEIKLFLVKKGEHCIVYETKWGGMPRIFSLFKNIFNIDCYGFELVREQANLLDNGNLE